MQCIFSKDPIFINTGASSNLQEIFLTVHIFGSIINQNLATSSLRLVFRLQLSYFLQYGNYYQDQFLFHSHLSFLSELTKLFIGYLYRTRVTILGLSYIVDAN